MAALYLLLPKVVNTEKTFALLSHASYVLLAFAVVLEVCALLGYANLTRFVLRVLDIRLRLTDVLAITLSSLAVSHVLSAGGVGGWVVTYNALRKRKVPHGLIFVAIAAQQFFNYAVLWFFFGREGTLVDPPVAHGAAEGERVPYRYLLTCPSIVAVCCTGFASYWGLALGLTWFTSYLVDGLGYSQKVGGNLSILPWIFGMVVVLGGGWISQRLKKAGVSSRLCRGAFAAATVTFGGCLLPFISHLPSPELKLAFLVVGTAIGSTIYVVMPMIVSELTPQPQRAAMLAIVTSIVTLAGVIAPLVMGAMIQNAPTRLIGYEQGFVVNGILLLAGGLIGLLFIRPEADRKRLAARAIAAPALRPARA